MRQKRIKDGKRINWGRRGQIVSSVSPRVRRTDCRLREVKSEGTFLPDKDVGVWLGAGETRQRGMSKESYSVRAAGGKQSVGFGI